MLEIKVKTNFFGMRVDLTAPYQGDEKPDKVRLLLFPART